MPTFSDLDLLHCPLQGTNLIEASAGTGKTYAIACLFLRLVLERRLSIKEILVVTFTEAATEELKDRIRNRLQEAIEAFSADRPKDEFLKGLAQKADHPQHALFRLKEAIRQFDEACIYTIHGFCRKMLHENAFESGNLFDTELVTDQEDIRREVVEDFWRIHLYKKPPLYLNFVMHRKETPRTLLSLCGKVAANTGIKIIPDQESPDSTTEEKEFQKAFDDVAGLWASARADVQNILLNDKGLKRVQYKVSKIPDWISQMDRWLGSDGKDPVLFDGFEKFCASELEGAVKKNYQPPVHPFFYFCDILKEKSDALIRIFDRQLLGLKFSLFHYLRQELERRKARQNIQSFDDLLTSLYKAVVGRGKEELRRNIRDKFKAGLIDEFQDTDPIQYGIFSRVFGVENRVLFMIGDPKQAIYGFRGADIFAYIEAATRAQKAYTLKENWRSEPGLITAVNTIFEGSAHPFVYGDIPFHAVAPAAGKTDHALLKIDGKTAEPSLHLWFVDADQIAGPEKTISKETAKRIITTSVAAEISRLLSSAREGKAVLGHRPIQESDLAVLVRENSEARFIQQALSRLHIPSVLHTMDDLFASHEALELERVLSGIARPEDEKKLKALLATDMMGLTGEALYRVTEDEIQWETWLVRTRGYQRLWETQGFIHMFKSLCAAEEVLPRLMSFSDGERRCTNTLHLSEVLHMASVKENLGMDGLVKWLSDRRNPEMQGNEEHQLRLESDENAVRLITIHRSKGLEYPIVFCPFAWAGARSRDKKAPVLFHDPSDRMRTILDLGSKEIQEHRASSEKEALAENLRLLYVALTRARNRCYLVWGRFNQADTSAPAYLFHHPDPADRADVVNEVSKTFSRLSREAFLSDLEQLCARSQYTVQLSEISDQSVYTDKAIAQKAPVLELPKFDGRIDQQFCISSFSSLVSQKTMPPQQNLFAEIPDHDAFHESEVMNPEELQEQMQIPPDIFLFPKGAAAGTFMHDIFEHVDYTAVDIPLIEPMVESKLSEYGFDSKWADTICQNLKNVLSIPLDLEQPDFSLSRISRKDRINELGFYFPLKPISPHSLERIFEKAPGNPFSKQFPEQVGRLRFSPSQGFMKGFMDLVFYFRGKYYLVDWKSNFLGSRMEDYDRDRLARVMEAHFYVLQYHIYCAALNQYLKIRLAGYEYEKHFGGVFYIFLRGVDPNLNPDCGIFRARPAGELIDALCNELIGPR